MRIGPDTNFIKKEVNIFSWFVTARIPYVGMSQATGLRTFGIFLKASQ